MSYPAIEDISRCTMLEEDKDIGQAKRRRQDETAGHRWQGGKAEWKDGDRWMGWKLMRWMSSSCSISRSLLERKCNNENSCSGQTHTQRRIHTSAHLAFHSPYADPHFCTSANRHTLTLTLEGLQLGGVSGAQPRGVATQNPLQVVGGITKEQIGFSIACWAEQAEALGGIAKHILQDRESVWQHLIHEGMHGCALAWSV